MLTTEIYFRNNRWWFAVLRLGRMGQTLEALVRRAARNRKDAHKQAAQALTHERNKQNANG